MTSALRAKRKNVEVAEGDVGYDDPVGVGDGGDGEEDDQIEKAAGIRRSSSVRR